MKNIIFAAFIGMTSVTAFAQNATTQSAQQHKAHKASTKSEGSGSIVPPSQNDKCGRPATQEQFKKCLTWGSGVTDDDIRAHEASQYESIDVQMKQMKELYDRPVEKERQRPATGAAKRNVQ